MRKDVSGGVNGRGRVTRELAQLLGTPGTYDRWLQQVGRIGPWAEVAYLARLCRAPLPFFTVPCCGEWNDPIQHRWRAWTDHYLTIADQDSDALDLVSLDLVGWGCLMASSESRIRELGMRLWSRRHLHGAVCSSQLPGIRRGRSPCSYPKS